MTTDAIDDGLLDAWVGFLRAHGTVIDVLERELVAKAGLPLTCYEILMRLKGAPGGAARMQDVARSLLLSKSGATRAVDRMEEAGLVERCRCPADGRGTYATITAAGRAALRRAMPVHLSGIQEHFGRHLSPRDSGVLRDAFRRIIDAHGSEAVPACEESAEPAAISDPAGRTPRKA